MSEHLILCAHGTRNPRGRQTIEQLRSLVAEQLPSTEVHLAYVDIQQPTIEDLATRLHRHTTVVVPLLFCEGFHVQVDLARAIANHPRMVASRSLGPHPALSDLVRQRLIQAGAQPNMPVVFAAAGSSMRQATQDALAAAALMAKGWFAPVVAGFGASAQPSVPDAVTLLRAQGHRRVAIGAYLLSHGHFHDQLGQARADLVSEPLSAAPEVVSVVLERFRAAVTELSTRAASPS